MKIASVILILIFNSLTTLAVTPKRFSPKQLFPFDRGYKIKDVPKNVIYITIDDGPTPKATPAVLDVLDKYQINATFFVQGEFAKNRQYLLERMYREGHLIGNHSWSHVLDFPTQNDFRNSLLSTHNIIIPYIANEHILLYRAPGGAWNPWRSQAGNSNSTLKQYVGPFYWNVGGGTENRVDDADYKCWDKKVPVKDCAQSYYSQIMSNYRKDQASLVLMHDLKINSAKMLDRVLYLLTKSGINWEFRLADNMPIAQEYSLK